MDMLISWSWYLKIGMKLMTRSRIISIVMQCKDKELKGLKTYFMSFLIGG
jgi:hypothetical protein